ICATCDQQPASGDEDCARVPETVQMTSTTSSNGFPLLGIPIELCPRALPCSLSLMQVHAAVCIHQILSTFRKRARPKTSRKLRGFSNRSVGGRSSPLPDQCSRE